MSTGHIVVQGASCECQFGNSPDDLVVQSQSKEFINDSGGSKKLIGNTMDIGMPFKGKTFGKCKLQPTSSGYLPCIPALQKWDDFYDKIELDNGGNILTEKSKATCAISGTPCVKFTWHGQTAQGGSSNVAQTDEETQSHLNPMVNIKKMEVSKENDLDTETAKWKRKEKEKVVSVNTTLYLKSTTELKTPYLDSKDKLKFKSSKPFIAGLRAIFGRDIKHSAAKMLKNDLEKGAVAPPKWEIDKNLKNDEAGYYYDKTIYLNEKLILEAEKDPVASWLLFRVMIEETGHYIDDLLRNTYDDIGGDAKGDEGTIFAADFIVYNQLLFKDFEFATFNIKGEDGEIREFKAKVNATTPSKRQKAEELVYVEDDTDDHGTVTLKSGEKVSVEFFKIRGMGAVHENITKQAAKIAGVIYDDRLDEGCAWPDAPCEKQDSIETCYPNMLINMDNPKGNTLVYRSHNGDLSYWHSMAPPGGFTNQQVVDKIVVQAKKWYMKAQKIEQKYTEESQTNAFTRFLEVKDYVGLFHIGKILHMVQDSYSRAHVFRNSKDEIIQIQSYSSQDSHKHGTADAVNQDWKIGGGGFGNFDATSREVNKVPGALDAREASVQILTFFKEGASEEALEEYLRTTVYKFGYKEDKKDEKYDEIFGADRKAGGTLEKFK
ncbi:DUF4280 domain-containing protein [Tenacibaculum finnmarkense]|uniref:DUF4280 domain-containing protein n=2 Tax=Tenacibaculum finnmarkense TaxID=2781243 RepID=UPI00187B6674|nr:DUF4280 domain-containing protein [Tenacibaculum finnmarkense]MBE7635102.1 DUF4280 domain-containing protein [Tenacibaculum finnmarkense genomovar ulcerans]MBE7649120.1 DUF4280 domain-containing protein [Tenacibaculum finnmarkense genomovar ulcerans]MCD8403840.1 DUF4280 domain-containing protein [Tenacibaculum finnmarkense genomovar finnmarkense]MCD8431051.1 DUF4280 domain-containing protein [Tenacibaculum finnmarkense genomovar ulcerans]MCD8433513.1 DUF4280 domain-containing protein [Tenac